VDLEPTDEDRQLREVVERILRDRAAAPTTTRDRAQADAVLLETLEGELGWRDLLAGTSPTALVQQCAVAEVCGRHAAALPVAALATGAKADGGAVVVVGAVGRAVRWPTSLTGVVVAPDGLLHPVTGAEVTHVGWGDPWGRVATGPPDEVPVPEATGRWYRLLLLAEGVGAVAGALERTVAYVAERQQFGSPLASRQALRHGLAESAAEVEAARLATFEAAATGAPEAALGLAATLFVLAEERAVPQLQRFTGAIGLSDEYQLHRLTGRARSIAAELGPPGQVAADAHRAVQEARR